MPINPQQQPSDAALITALHEGSETSLNQFFALHNRSLLYFAKSMVRNQEAAEEIVSDSFVKVWQRRATFETADKVKAFLYIATKNACLNYVKSAYVQQDFDHELDEQLLSTDPDVLAKLVRTELLEVIYQEVLQLPEKQREVFRLTYLEDLTTEEICAQLGMTPTAVFANRSRAVEALRKIFKDKDMLLCLLLLQALVNNARVHL